MTHRGIDTTVHVRIEPVVRCKRCKHFVPSPQGKHDRGICRVVGSTDSVSGLAYGFVNPLPDDFCSYGECKEG